MEKETAKCDSDFKEMAAAVKCKEEDKTVDRLRSLKTWFMWFMSSNKKSYLFCE